MPLPILGALAAKEGTKAAWRIAKWVVPALVLIGLGLTIFILNTKLDNRTAERNLLRTWQTTILDVIRAEIPVGRRRSVTADTAGDEVRWLGREYRQLNVDLQRMSKMLLEASDKANDARNSALEARRKAVEANSGREAVRQRLLDQKRSTGLTEAEWRQL